MLFRSGSIMSILNTEGIRQSSVLNQLISPINNGDTVFEIFKYTLISVSIIAISTFMFGFFAMGQPFSVLLLAYRGFGIGASVALTYIEYGQKGLYITLLFIVPKILATTIIIILAVRESLKMSAQLYRYMFRGHIEENIGKLVKLYCIKFLILILFVFIVSILDSLLNYFLGKLL